jgi:signal transduction histidine kinase
MSFGPEPIYPEFRPDPADALGMATRLRRRERELRAIRQLSRALHARTNLDDLEREALAVTIATLEAEGGTIYLHHPPKQVLVFSYVVGATPEITAHLQNMEMSDKIGIAGQVFHSGVGRISPQVSEDRDHNAAVDVATNFRTESSITVPLIGMDGQRLGVLQVLNRKTGRFDEEDLEVLEILGSQAGSAIENARLYDEARRASVINLIGDISHDVKNFLTPVVTGTQTLELMMDSMFEDFDATLSTVPREYHDALRGAIRSVRGFYKEAVEMTCEGAEDAQERVREIADAIKGVISQPHFEETDFRERVEAVVRVLGLVAERRSVSIDLSGLQDTGPVELDRKGIYNAMYNLINNAIPETPEGGKIMVRSRLIDFDGQPGLEIQVADTGRGMPPHVRARMFTDNAISTKVGGTGLGTRIVKNVVDAHHGRISVESEEGQGTTFTIQIPIRQP